ncbi:MAG: hypothetical protein WKF77_20885 [Planctomycetaceae bacterium]
MKHINRPMMPIVAHEEQSQIGGICVAGDRKTGEQKNGSEVYGNCRDELHIAALDFASGGKPLRTINIAVGVERKTGSSTNEVRDLEMADSGGVEPACGVKPL